MPCFGPAWNEELTPGTKEYIEAEAGVRKQLDSLLHVVHYYCKVYGRALPAEFHYSGSNFEALPQADKQLLAAIYHHLRCDGISAAVVHDILALLDLEPLESSDRYATVQICQRLMRSGMLIKLEFR